MTNLFIIGNGFDVSHGLETKYSDFRSYLIEKYNIKPSEGYPYPPEPIIGHHGEEIIEDNEIAEFIIHLLDNNCDNCNDFWSDLEESLPDIDFSYFLDDDLKVNDNEGDENPWHTETNFVLVSNNLEKTITKIPSLFNKWIKTINITKAETQAKFIELVNKKDDLFFTFNYTLVLEKQYGINQNNICHIHGYVDNGDIKFGHNSEANYDFDKDYPYHNVNEILNNIINSLKKDIADSIEKNHEFFNKLKTSNIKNIYSYGFSYSDVDKDYLKKICKEIDTVNITWYFNDYDNDSHDEYKQTLIVCGYKGKFDTFHIY